MKLPEPLFVVINPTMRLVLSSPLHFLVSRSLLLIRYKGRRTGIWRTTPLRYVQDGDAIRCFTSKGTQWWRNLQDGAEVTLTVRGKRLEYEATAITDPNRTRPLLAAYLEQYPQDATYHDVSLTATGTPDPATLDQAASNSVVVEAHPLPAR